MYSVAISVVYCIAIGMVRGSVWLGVSRVGVRYARLAVRRTWLSPQTWLRAHPGKYMYRGNER